MKLNLFNQTRQKINLRRFEKIAELFSEVEGNIEITFVGKTQIQTANRNFRFKDKPTDVLSFGYEQDAEMLGEVLIYPKCFARTLGELDRLIIHGILHILGYDHERDELEAQEMETIQEHLLEKFRNQN